MVFLPLQRCIIQMTKFQAHKPSARLQYTMGFRQNAFDVRTISYAKRNRVRRKGVVVEWQLFSIGTDPIDANGGVVTVECQLFGSPFANVQHILIDIGDCDMAKGKLCFGATATTRQ